MGLFNYTRDRYETKKAIEAALNDRVRDIYQTILRSCFVKIFYP